MLWACLIFTIVVSCCSYEELLMDSSDDEEEQKSERKPKGREGKQRGVARGRAWIKEDNEESPVNFLDPGIAQRVVGKSNVLIIL